MTRIRMKTIRELDEAGLQKRLQDARSELSKLKIDDSQGKLRKHTGNIKPLKRDIARMLTRLNEMKK